jgi:hypothetical protein
MFLLDTPADCSGVRAGAPAFAAPRNIQNWQKNLAVPIDKKPALGFSRRVRV